MYFSLNIRSEFMLKARESPLENEETVISDTQDIGRLQSGEKREDEFTSQDQLS